VPQITPTQQDTPRWMGAFMSLHTWPYLMHVALLVALYVGTAKLGLSLHIDFSYLIFPVLIWAARRFGPPGASAASAVVSSLAIWGTAHEGGPFVSGTFHENVLALQTFMSVVAGTVLVLAAVVAERKRAELRLVAHDATTHVLAEVSTPKEVIPRAFQTICESLDWDMGALWHVDREAQVLRYGERR
jgi:integral membrane sensor domain MASE1